MYLLNISNLIFFVVLGASGISAVLLSAVWRKTDSAYRPSIVSAYRLHFRTFLSCLIFAGLPLQISFHNDLTFLEFLAQQNLSPKVIKY